MYTSVAVRSSLAVMLLGFAAAAAAVVAEDEKVDSVRKLHNAPNHHDDDLKHRQPHHTSDTEGDTGPVATASRRFSASSTFRDSRPPVSASRGTDPAAAADDTSDRSHTQPGHGSPSSHSAPHGSFDSFHGNGDATGGHHQQHLKEIPRQQGHHVSRRSFDSINVDSGLRGMGQNFFGSQVDMRSKGTPYAHHQASQLFPEWKRESSAGPSSDEPLAASLNRRLYKQGDVESLEDALARYQELSEPALASDQSLNEKGDYYETLLSYLPLWLRQALETYAPNGDINDSAEEISFNDILDQLQSLRNSPKDSVVKRGFDSIARWNGGISGLSQNFVGPKRGDFDSFRRNFHRNMADVFGMNKRENLQPKRSFDSISNGFTSGIHQNYLGKKANSFRENHWWPHSQGNDYITKRDWRDLATDVGTNLDNDLFKESKKFDSIDFGLSGLRQNYIDKRKDSADKGDDAKGILGVYSPHHFFTEGYGWNSGDPLDTDRMVQNKRSFDTIDQGYLSGLGQNHIGKRAPIPLAIGGVRKRTFDSIDSNSELSSVFQNYVSKRALEVDPNEDLDEDSGLRKNKRFDSIASGSLGGMGQNYISKRYPDLVSNRRSFDPISIGMLGGTNQHFISKRSVSSSLPSNQQTGEKSKRQFDSISRGSGLGGMHQNFFSSKKASDADAADHSAFGSTVFSDGVPYKRGFDSIEHSRLGGMAQNFFNKRYFDSIDSSRVGGLRQNFFDKRNLDSIGRSGFGGMKQNFISKRYFDSIDSSRVGGLKQNFFDKRNFYSIQHGRVGGLRQNFFDKRNFDSIQHGRVGGLRQNFFDKRKFDSIQHGRVGGLRQNFFDKRNFDSIQHGRVGGLRQNFFDKRNFDSIQHGRVGGLRQNFFDKRNFDSIQHGRVGGLRHNFFDKRNFDSIDTSRVGGFSRNFISKRRFDSIGQSQMSGLRQNFISKRNGGRISRQLPNSKRSFDSIEGNGVGGMRQNFISKRSFDSVDNGFLGGLRQNFVSKRYFDPISDGRLGGMSQNFISKRLEYLSAQNPTHGGHAGSLTVSGLREAAQIFDPHSPPSDLTQQLAILDAGVSLPETDDTLSGGQAHTSGLLHTAGTSPAMHDDDFQPSENNEGLPSEVQANSQGTSVPKGAPILGETAGRSPAGDEERLASKSDGSDETASMTHKQTVQDFKTTGDDSTLQKKRNNNNNNSNNNEAR